MEFSILVISISFLIGFILAFFISRFLRDIYWKGQLIGHRRDAIRRSRSVLSGQFSEQLAPILPGFDHLPTECRFVGKPIDFIVFRGLDEKRVDEVVFLEVKSGKSGLSEVEKSLKEAVNRGDVRWEEYRVDEEVTGSLGI